MSQAIGTDCLLVGNLWAAAWADKKAYDAHAAKRSWRPKPTAMSLAAKGPLTMTGQRPCASQRAIDVECFNGTIEEASRAADSKSALTWGTAWIASAIWTGSMSRVIKIAGPWFSIVKCCTGASLRSIESMWQSARIPSATIGP